MRTQRFLLSILLSVVAVSAMAFERPFPQDIKRGTMSPAQYPTIIIDGNLRRLTAGAQIRNQNNMIQMPATLADAEYVVNYTEDLQGEIKRIWILTPVEASQSIKPQ